MGGQQTGLYRVTVPFGHCDIAGIAYTPRFNEYCMDAAEVFLKRRVGLDWHAINRAGDYATPVMHYSIDFHNSVRIGDQLDIAIAVQRVGRSSFGLAFTGRKAVEGVPAFSAEMVFAFVDLRAGESLPIPDRYLTPLQELVKEENH